ncbi:hypothetical protein FA13DRAFT_207254 [Coprinellus micaceus]|uniref:Uncharacterized protein n=1 Tax=Coprinellus micaceus TaxID=71717 RepID=A0A4Y7SFE9_COPMI|nr:hypothetical protein FA13DRAFT_207254 [Coprinellus micaceus]
MIATAFVLQRVDTEKLAVLQMVTLPLGLFSKLPQIPQNGCLHTIPPLLSTLTPPFVPPPSSVRRRRSKGHGPS